MDRSMMLDHLAKAERHVTEGAERVARQRALLKELQRDGHDTSQAEDLLAVLEATQTLHVADRDRVLSELAKEDGKGSA